MTRPTFRVLTTYILAKHQQTEIPDNLYQLFINNLQKDFKEVINSIVIYKCIQNLFKKKTMLNVYHLCCSLSTQMELKLYIN